MITRLLAMAAVLAFAACAPLSPPPATPPVTSATPPAMSLVPVTYAMLPGWSDDSHGLALPALRRSCQRIAQMPAGQRLGGDGSVAGDWLAPCGALRTVPDDDGDAARVYFETWFAPFRVLSNGQPEGLFTGYYEAELRGARHADRRFRVPIYSRPEGLPADPAEGGKQPFLTRAEIEAGALAGKARELLWVDDPVDAHILHIQGSGRILMDDGTIVRVGFNGSNGQPFVGLGKILQVHGKLQPGDTTMQAVRAWLKSHPAEAPALMAENPRYVFFRMISGDGPVGAAGVPLTAGRSLAVDPRFVAYGTPVWLDAKDPDGQPLRRVMVAQDTGAAIKGPIRGDVFWGSGEPAMDIAGRMKSRGGYYLLLPRNHTVPVAEIGGEEPVPARPRPLVMTGTGS